MPKRHPRHNISFDKIRLPKRQYVTAHKSGNAWPVHETQDQNDIPQTRFKNGSRHQHKQYIGKRHDHIRKTHDEHIRHTAKISRNQSQNHTNDRGYQRRHHTY